MTNVPQPFRYMLTCTQCRLSRDRTQVVVGRGPTKGVEFLFIGEAPGEQEDKDGVPFVGQAGQRLSALMDQAGIEESQVYITNIVKCRPPGNRVPSSMEVKSCSAHLLLQVKLIRPKLLVLVGNTTLQYFFPHLKIMSVHGKRGPDKLGVPTYPIIHPSATLHHPAWIDLLLDDLKNLGTTDFKPKPIKIGPRVID